jgi:hypothetical protein
MDLASVCDQADLASAPDFRYDAAGKGGDGDVHEIVLGRENASGLDHDYSRVPILTHSRIFRAHGKPKSLIVIGACHLQPVLHALSMHWSVQ